MKRNICTVLMVISLFFTVLFPCVSYAEREGTLTFAWTVEPDAVETHKITELRVYQDSSDNMMISSVDPLAGTVTVTTTINDCSNFWATYATISDESNRTEAIKACEPKLGDPEPAQSIIEVGGFKLTIDFEPLKY